MSNYRKTMTEALREMYPLDESVIDKVKEIASKKQAMKIDGVMVDSFTASAISQIYDKVNDANKKKMEKLPITKLANLAFKLMQKNFSTAGFECFNVYINSKPKTKSRLAI